jgi:hypothetical protein
MSEEAWNCSICGREGVSEVRHVTGFSALEGRYICVDLPKAPDLIPYDLQAPIDPPPIANWSPLRGPIPGRPETHAERMARTDRQLEQARREAQLHDAVTTAQAEWAGTRTTWEVRRNTVAVAVLYVHHPAAKGQRVVCAECFDSGIGYEAEPVDWPCRTYSTIRGLI